MEERSEYQLYSVSISQSIWRIKYRKRN